MDISLGDVVWVGGSLIAFVTIMSLLPYARPAARTVAAIWRQAQDSGLIRINIVKDYGNKGEPEEEPKGGEITSTAGSRPPRTGSEPGDLPPVPPDTEAERTSSAEAIEPPPAIISHKMPTPDLIVFLAVQKDDNGDYRWSANKIVEFVGGTRADVIARIAAVRVKPAPAQPPMSGRVERPQGGW